MENETYYYPNWCSLCRNPVPHCKCGTKPATGHGHGLGETAPIFEPRPVVTLKSLEDKMDALMEEFKSVKYNLHLHQTSEKVKTWPEWKQSMIGPSSAMLAAMKEIERLEKRLEEKDKLMIELRRENKSTKLLLNAVQPVINKALDYVTCGCGGIPDEEPCCFEPDSISKRNWLPLAMAVKIYLHGDPK